MTLTFRNVTADPADRVESWPYEGLVSAIERGSISDWARIAVAIGRSPWGEVARQVEDYLGYASPYGVGPLLQRVVLRARREAELDERAQAAAEVRELIDRSGLSRADFARQVGTSTSRLSTYASGRVTPSAAMLVRMRRLVESDS